MRLLHVVPTYMPAWRYGGPIRSVHGLCSALAERGHEVHVFTTNVDGPDDLDVPLGCPVDIDGVLVTYFPVRYMRRLYWSPEMGKALKAFVPGCDLVHLHPIFNWPTWAAARVSRHYGVPYGISPHGMLILDLIRRKSRFLKSAWIALIDRHNIKKADFLHVTSQLEAEEIRRFGMPLPPITIIPNGLDPGSMQEDKTGSLRGLPSDGPFLLFLGRISWKKGLDRLICALASMPDAYLVIAGNDEEACIPVLKAIAQKLEVTKRVQFTGEIRGSTKRELMQRASLFVLPSYSENFGNVILEALAEGLPVAVTADVGLASTVHEAGAGIILPDEPVAMGAMMKDLLADEKLRKTMGQKGQILAKENFSWKTIATHMEAQYNHFISRKIQCQ